MKNNYTLQFAAKLPGINFLSHTDVYLVLYDQLNSNNFPSWVKKEKPLLLFIESLQAEKVMSFHKKKLIFKFSAMRHFALECSKLGYPISYHSTANDFSTSIISIFESNKNWKLHYMTPNEWDSKQALNKFKSQFQNTTEYPNNFFLASVEKYAERILNGWRMEYFYREIRKQTGYLMDGDTPLGGQWNYDKENRKKLPKHITLPGVFKVEPDEITQEVIDMVEGQFSNNFGKSANFNFGVSRSHGLNALNLFLEKGLKNFGPYEDAMTTRGSVLFHSQLSIYMNIGLISPKEVCDAAIEYAEHTKSVPLSSLEGFIRQIIGWREFIRIYYEAMMPDVREANYFGFGKDLPAAYWTAKTKMKCLSECVRPVIEQGYVHHIPRLMILSNFSNLTGTDPRALNEWFWLGFVDAYEWVVLPNVLGMSTFADGGVLASKPYVAGGNYVNKMSDYCGNCVYDVKEKTGDNACPLNYLYWNFIDEQRDTFRQNGRANFMVNTFDKKSNEEKNAIRESSEKFLANLPRLSKKDWLEKESSKS